MKPSTPDAPSAVCETCGGERLAPIFITMGGATHCFDSFECAIERLAPRCRACGTHVIGHGVHEHGAMYCSERCARQGPPTLAFTET